jgi:flagellar biosynthesis anti-sigma factor FlgM
MDMRISSVYNAYNAQPSRGTQQAAKVDSGRAIDADSVSLSAQAGEYQIARKAVQSAPDIRESLVNRIQEMLDAGTYHVSTQDVAASILGR